MQGAHAFAQESMPRGYGDPLARHPCQATRPLSLQRGCVQLVDILVVTPRSDLEKRIEFSARARHKSRRHSVPIPRDR
jgi:hypothetical protein